MLNRRSGMGIGLLATLAVLVPGCAEWFQRKPTTRPAGTLGSAEASLQIPYATLLKGTVAEFTYVEGWQPLNVRGYGLVTGLAGQGSRNCPPTVRERIAKEIRRRRAANPLRDTHLPPAEKLIDSLDTAVVQVEGRIPPGAAKKRVFDVFVRAVDPDTRSIAEGYLQPCDLHIYTDQGPAGTIEGRIWARAAGTVFINPFAGETRSATNVDPREGIVIGGGWNLKPRTLSLVSVIESYGIVRQIRDTINRRFPADEPVADAINPTHVTLTVPPAFRGRELRFIEIVRHLPLTNIQAELEARAKWLASELTQPEAPVNEIALCLEGLGQLSLPMLQPLYTHPRPAVNYSAARTGLRLGDGLALDIVAQHAKDPRSPFRRQAIRELGECTKKRLAAGTLHELLADPDPRIQVEAYEALRKADPGAIWQVSVGRNPPNFLLEMTPSDGEPVIYARRTGIRRIALIGGDRMVCHPPLLYAEEHKPVLLSAKQGDLSVSILRRDRNGKVVLGPIRGPLAVPALVRLLGENFERNHEGKFVGLALDYAVILDVLYELARSNAINARFRWEEPSVEDVTGPLTPMGRPESEL